jgi:hypothetical protein
MPPGPQLALAWAQTRRPQPQNADASIAVGGVLVVTVGAGCDTAVDFASNGPVQITGTQPAPLANSGANAAQLTATSVGTATVRILGHRTCSTQGVTTGMCFGATGLLGTVTIHVRAH